MYYRYDPNGNVIEERLGGHSEENDGGTFSYTYPEPDLTRASQAFGWNRGDGTETDATYCRTYTWDEENRLTGTSDPSNTTVYSYDHEGERTVKYSDLGETLYFDSMWLEADTDGTGRLRRTKNIYIGETRIASKLNYEGEGVDYESSHTFYYHTDHLSSSNVVTDSEGDVYEHMEYTPYGEKWILDQNDSSKYDMIPYRFTAKEWDEETGLYYMSARYQNPEASRWVSADPAGWGLVNPNREGFNTIESQNWYSYSGNNPVTYRDPTGNVIEKFYAFFNMSNVGDNIKLGNSSTIKFNKQGCYATTYANVLASIQLRNYRSTSRRIDTTSDMDVNNNKTLFAKDSGNMAGRNKSMNLAFGFGKWDYWTKDVQGADGLKEKMKEYADSGKSYMIMGIFDLSDATDDVDNHMVGITGEADENGLFSPESIVSTSDGDRQRLSDETKQKEYSLENLKEIRIVEVE